MPRYAAPPMPLMHRALHISLNKARSSVNSSLTYSSVGQTRVCTEACIMSGLVLAMHMAVLVLFSLLLV